MPLSTQWSSTEYAYPTQIAQYGLSHYSRYVETPSPGGAARRVGAAADPDTPDGRGVLVVQVGGRGLGGGGARGDSPAEQLRGCEVGASRVS